MILCAPGVYRKPANRAVRGIILSVSEIRAAEPMCYELIVIIGLKPESLITYQQLYHTSTSRRHREYLLK